MKKFFCIFLSIVVLIVAKETNLEKDINKMIFKCNDGMQDICNEISDIFIEKDKECDMNYSSKSCLWLAINVNRVPNPENSFNLIYLEKSCQGESIHPSSNSCSLIADYYFAEHENTKYKNFFLYLALKYYKKACDIRKQDICDMEKIIKNIMEQ